MMTDAEVAEFRREPREEVGAKIVLVGTNLAQIVAFVVALYWSGWAGDYARATFWLALALWFKTDLRPKPRGVQ